MPEHPHRIVIISIIEIDTIILLIPVISHKASY